MIFVWKSVLRLRPWKNVSGVFGGATGGFAFVFDFDLEKLIGGEAMLLLLLLLLFPLDGDDGEDGLGGIDLDLDSDSEESLPMESDADAKRRFCIDESQPLS